MRNIGQTVRSIALASLLFPAQSFAQTHIQDLGQMMLLQQVCPPTEALIQDPTKRTWFAPSGWYSTNPSFFRELGRFVGAQWVGVSVGKVICSYTGKKQSTFIVHIQRNDLVPSPSGGLWQKDQGGYKNCFSHDPQECGYFSMTPAKPKSVYDQIDFYGNRHSSDLDDTP